LRFFSFGGYGLALAALALVVFGAYDSYPDVSRLCFMWSTPVLGVTEGEHESIIFQDKPFNNHMNENVSSRALH